MGRCKALIDIEGQSAIRRLVAAATGDGRHAVPVLVVVGADAAAIQTELAGSTGVEIVCNQDWQQGRTSSFQCAIGARPGLDLLLAPVDHPLVPPELFQSLRASWEEAGAPARGWLAPRVTRPGLPAAFGHPIVVGRELLADAPSLTSDSSFRELRSRATPLLSVPADARALANLDKPGDLEGFSPGQF